MTSRPCTSCRKGVFTNTPQSGPYRGAGRPEAAYFIERMIEHAAKQIGMDLRRDPPPQSHPAGQAALHHADATGSTTPASSCACSTSASRRRLEGLRGAPARHRKRTASCAAARSAIYIEFGGIFNDRMDMPLRSGRHAHDLRRHAFARPGPRHGVRAARARIARRAVRDRSATCRATPPRCRSAAAPTARAARWSAAMRSKCAADAIIEKAKPMAAAMMEADAGDIEFKDGNFRVAGTDKAITLVEVAKASYAPMGPMTGKFGIGLEGTGSFSPSRRAIRTARMSVEVEVDPETGDGRGRPLLRGRRSRPRAQSDDRARPAAWAAWCRASARR